MKALFDTNILIDYLNGIEAARTELRRYAQPLISPISWMEVMSGVGAGDDIAVRQFLAGFRQVIIDQSVSERAVALRRAHKLRLPDAIIWASAQCESALLITRDRKDFPADDPGVRLPYDL